jgi:hypothetical protein
MYCDGNGNNEPDGYCSAGWYCPGGQDDSMPTGYNCTMGHYCPVGSSAPLNIRLDIVYETDYLLDNKLLQDRCYLQKYQTCLSTKYIWKINKFILKPA